MPTLEILLRYFELFSGLLLVGSSLKQNIFEFIDRVFWIESPLHLNNLEFPLDQNARLGEQNSIFLYPSIASVGYDSLSSQSLSDLTVLMETLSPFIQQMISSVGAEVNPVMNQIDPLMLYSLRFNFRQSRRIKGDKSPTEYCRNAMRYFHTRFAFALQIYAEICAYNTHYATEVENLFGSLISHFKSNLLKKTTMNHMFEVELTMLRFPFTEWITRYGADILGKMVALELIELRLLAVFETLPSDFSTFYSILECSAWVQKNPHARNVRLTNSKVLEWVWPTLQAIAAKAKEEDLGNINHQVGFKFKCVFIDMSIEPPLRCVLVQGILFQDLLWLFIDHVHFDPSIAAISSLDKNLERVAFTWSKLERYILDYMPTISRECRVYLQNFSNSLGFNSELAQPNLKSALGAPQIPPSREMFDIQLDILSHCSRIRFTSPDFEGSNDSDHKVGIDPGDGALKLQVLEGLTIIMAVNFGYGLRSLAISKDAVSTIKSMKSIQYRSREKSEEQMILEALRANTLTLTSIQAFISFDQIWPAQAAKMDVDVMNLVIYLEKAEELIVNSPRSNLTSALPYALMRKYVGSIQGKSVREMKQGKQNIFDSLGNQLMLQFYRDLRSVSFCMGGLQETAGPQVLHCCGMLWVIKDFVQDNQLPSLRSEALRIQQLDYILKGIRAYNEDGLVCLSKIELKFAMSTLIVILDSLSPTCSLEVLQSKAKSLTLDSIIESREHQARLYSLVRQVAKTAGKNAASGILESCLLESADSLLLNDNVLCDTAAGK